jgi:hypothetical protein
MTLTYTTRHALKVARSRLTRAKWARDKYMSRFLAHARPKDVAYFQREIDLAERHVKYLEERLKQEMKE